MKLEGQITYDLKEFGKLLRGSRFKIGLEGENMDL